MSTSWSIPKGPDEPFVPKGEWFVKCKSGLFFDNWMYFDSLDYCADKLFNKRGIFVAYGPEYANDSSRYVAIMCRTPKFQRGKFVDAMKEMLYVMAIYGYSDYEDFCVAEIEKIKAFRK